MDIAEILKDNLDTWIFKPPPASEESINNLVLNAGPALPEKYLDFLRFTNGGEGELGIDPWYFQVWPAEEVIDSNRNYGVQEYIPGFFAFGTNGGGELLAFDMRHEDERRVFMIPMIPMSESDAVEIAPDFETFAMVCGMAPPKK